MANMNNSNGMKKTEVLRALKDEGMGLFQSILDDHDAIKTGDYVYVVESATLPGKYFQVAITAKDVITDDDGKRIPYDPFIEVDRYERKSDSRQRSASASMTKPSSGQPSAEQRRKPTPKRRKPQRRKPPKLPQSKHRRRATVRRFTFGSKCRAAALQSKCKCRLTTLRLS